MIEFLCLQCCDCKTFQCQQKRKDKKFTCKMCGKKQSVVKVYGISYKGKDIRGLVMKYNEMRGRGELVDQEQAQQLPPPTDDCNDFVDEYDCMYPQDEGQENASKSPEVSKWAQFLDDDDGDGKDQNGNDGKNDDEDEDDVVQAFLMKRQRLQEKKERRRQSPYQKRVPPKEKTLPTEKEAPKPSSDFPKVNLNRFKEHAKVIAPPPAKRSKGRDGSEDEDDDEEEEAGTKKIVVDPNSKWAAFL